MTAERDALKADVERLREAASKVDAVTDHKFFEEPVRIALDELAEAVGPHAVTRRALQGGE